MNRWGRRRLAATPRQTVSSLLLLLVSPMLQAGENLLIVGGGPMPKDSQVSIERNVIWIDALTNVPDFASRQLLFTAGPEKVNDVVEEQHNNKEHQKYLPLARMFGSTKDALAVFRANRIKHVDGAATAAGVDRHFSEALKTMKHGDGLWFIFNGHGGMPSSDPSENTLRLWNDSTLDVRRFSTIANARPAGTVLRSFMPQCFSGGFARSIARDPANPDAEHIDPLQCGFYSVPANLESEGCTISVDSGQYNDYSTYFFAALAGRDRHGNRVDIQTQHGKRPTLLDAHTWAYINGNSTDILFSSSEYFLELWQPWYVRWQTVTSMAEDNPYFLTAKKIALKTGISTASIHKMAAQTRSAISEMAKTINAMRSKQEHARNKEALLRQKLLQAFLPLFPEAAFPYSAGSANRLQKDASNMLQWIKSQPDYPALEKLQQDIATLDERLLETRRKQTTYIRLQHMLKLATLREIFFRSASPALRKTYDALLRCESWTPPLSVLKPSAGTQQQ